VAIVLAAGNDFVVGDLRVDLSEVYNATDYKVHLLASDEPSSGSDDDFTTAWLGVFLAQYIPGVPDSGQFSQVGLLTKKDGIRWFVYAEPTVTCLRGWHDPGDDRHCYGFVNDLVALGSWHQVELVKYTQNNYWIARVYDSGGTAYDVAKIWSNSNRIYMARSDTEEGYVENSDPYLTASFYHWHPQYMGAGWQEWPESSGNNCNSIWTDAINGPDPCPAHYGADPYWTGDPRAWFAGTAGKWCDVDPLFPATYTYLPDIKANYNGWNSTIIVRNNGGGDAHVQVAFYDSNGIVVAYPNNTNLHGQAIWTLEASNVVNNFSGSAIVYASQDVSVVVENHNSSSGRTYAYNGIIPAGGYGDPTFERTGTTLYAPTMYGNQWGWDSTVEVMNTGSATANVQIQFKGRSGYGDTTRTYSIPPNGRLEVAASSVWGGTSWVGSLVIQSTNGPPLAAVVHEHHTSQATRAYNASSAGSSTLYVPAAYKNKWDMTTGLVVQNVGSSRTTAYLYFYNREGGYSAFRALSDIDVGRAQGLWLGDESALPDVWTGWVKVGSSGQPLAVYVNTVRPEGHYAYTGASTPGNTATLPYAAKNANGGSTGYTVLNTSQSGVQVRANYYKNDGTEARSPEYYWLEPRAVTGRHQSLDPDLPPVWTGSIVLQASQPLVAVMREDGSSTTSAYNGVAR